MILWTTFYVMDALLQLTNETLSAVIVIVSASMLLYNLTRNLHARVARASSALLACVTFVYTVDAFTSLNPTTASLSAWLRVQWIGIALAPAALFHLSDALLATTGLVSRGRRRRVARQLYVFSLLFLIMAAFSDALVYGLVREPAPHLLPGPVFPLYVVFFLLATIVSFYNLVRARRRCRTTYTRRRMSYLLYSFAMPALGIFPFTLLFSSAEASPSTFWLIVNLGNVGITLMLLFMAYPLYFFGSNVPDRVVKAELLHFFLRGPFTGILVLLIILFLPQAGRILGLSSEQFMPFAAVAVVMFWQWMVSWLSPHLERWIVYTSDQAQVRIIQSIGHRLLTHNDMQQLLESILAALCDLLQVPAAFVAAFEGDQARLEQVIGDWLPDWDWRDTTGLYALLQVNGDRAEEIRTWNAFWVVPLYGGRGWGNHDSNGASSRRLLGVLGVRARSAEPDLLPEEQSVFDLLARQAAQTLDDQRLQAEVFASLEGLLPEMEAIQQLRGVARYGDLPALAQAERTAMLEPGSAAFVDAVRDALRDYWGGPRLTDSRLLQLQVVQKTLTQNDGNPTRALRTVLLEAINRLKPPGERSMTRTEWILYNIIELRFIQGHKVRDVARRLAMSEADLYRKQRTAVEEVARALADMERACRDEQTPEAVALHVGAQV